MANSKKLDENGFHHILLIVVIVVVAVVGFVGFRVIYNATNQKHPESSSTPNPNDQGPNYKALAACTKDQVLTTLPIDLAAIDTISPLGSINPPEHTIPTDHNYFMYHYERPDESYNIMAPADGVITSFGYTGGLQNGKPENADFSINFSPCRGLAFRFSHMNALAGKLKGELGPDGKGGDCNTSKPTTQREIINCSKNVDIKVSAGDLMALVGAKYVAAWDFWAWKEGYANPGITTPAYRYDTDVVCGLDYFVDDLKAQLYAKVKRIGEPKCGDVGVDKKNTLQGSWFAHKDPEKARTDWNSHLTLAHTSDDANKGVLAVAGKIVDPSIYLFDPADEGTINREPSQTAPGTVYCYEHEGSQRLDNGTMAGGGKVLLKLINNNTMQAEYRSGDCNNAETLSSPTTYYR